MTEDERREMMRSNYAAQMEMLGYDSGGNPLEMVRVRHGRWEERHHAYSDEEAPIEEWQSAKCSECGLYHTTPYLYYFTNYKFCPHCGAKMDGGPDA